MRSLRYWTLKELSLDAHLSSLRSFSILSLPPLPLSPPPPLGPPLGDLPLEVELDIQLNSQWNIIHKLWKLLPPPHTNTTVAHEGNLYERAQDISIAFVIFTSSSLAMAMILVYLVHLILILFSSVASLLTNASSPLPLLSPLPPLLSPLLLLLFLLLFALSHKISFILEWFLKL
jgi:hypothetical protein